MGTSARGNLSTHIRTSSFGLFKKSISDSKEDHGKMRGMRAKRQTGPDPDPATTASVHVPPGALGGVPFDLVMSLAKHFEILEIVVILDPEEQFNGR